MAREGQLEEDSPDPREYISFVLWDWLDAGALQATVKSIKRTAGMRIFITFMVPSLV